MNCSSTIFIFRGIIIWTNIHYNKKKSEISLWNGKERIDVDWTPFLYQKTDVETEVKSIYGDNVTKKTFNSYNEYNEYQKYASDIFENKVQPEIQFLTEKFNNIKDYTPPELHVAFIDIETPHADGFPTPEKVPAQVTLIAIVDEKGKKTVFGLYDYHGVDYECYILCSDEYDLLEKFYMFMRRESFDVISGWNITSDSKMNKFGGFDLPYLIRRTQKLYGKGTTLFNKLSPINDVRIWKSKNKDGVYSVNISGVTVIDYLGLYKWFTSRNLESYKLDYVAEIELKKNKLDYSEYGSLYMFSIKNGSKFVDYCIRDSQIVVDIDKKCGYLKLAQTLTMLCCTPMKNYNSSVPLIEGLMLKHYRSNKLCAPYLHGGTQEWYPAAYVKEPQIGLHEDVIDLDIASSYPTHIIILNMSLETYFGRIVGFNKKEVFEFKTDKGIHEPTHEGRPFYDKIVGYCRDKKFPPFTVLKENGYTTYNDKQMDIFNRSFNNKLFSIAPNGAIFMNNVKGVIAKVEQSTYNERKKQKGLMSQYKKDALVEGITSKKVTDLKTLADNKFTLQWSIKILINSMYGVMAVPYSRYMNIHIAEAITSCARHTIKQGEIFVDDLLNKPDDKLSSIIERVKGTINE